MSDLEILNNLIKEGLPSNIDLNVVEDKLRHYLNALNQRNEAKRHDASENLKFLLPKREFIERGIPGRAQENTALPLKVLELINETIDALQFESSERIDLSLQESTNSSDENAEQDKNN